MSEISSSNTADTKSITSAANPSVKSSLLLHGGWIAVCLLVCGVSYSWSKSVLTPQRSRNFLQILPKKLNFGTVFPNTNFTWTVPIKNISSRELIIDNIELSCACIKVEPSKLTLQPGGVKDLIFDIALPEYGASQPSPFTVSFKPIFGFLEVEHDSWNISGLVKSTFKVDTQNILLEGADRIRVGEPMKLIPIRGVKNDPAIQLSFTCSSEIGKIVEHNSNGEEGLLAYFLPADNKPPGHHSGQITLVASINGSPIGQKEIPVRLDVVGMASITPHSLDMGTHSIGATATSRFIIAALQNRPFTVVQDIAQETEVEFNIQQDAEKLSAFIEVRMKIEREGRYSGIVQLCVLSLDNQDTELIKMPFDYYGTR